MDTAGKLGGAAGQKKRKEGRIWKERKKRFAGEREGRSESLVCSEGRRARVGQEVKKEMTGCG